jgi:ABC-2 type transport system ATP-binding protein
MSVIEVRNLRKRYGDTVAVRDVFYPEPADWRVLAAELGLGGKLKTRFAKLSGGQQQRLSIALA